MWTTLDGQTLTVTRSGLRKLVPGVKRHRDLWRLVLRNYRSSLSRVLLRLLRKLASNAVYAGMRGRHQVFMTDLGGRAYQLFVRPVPDAPGRIVWLREQAPTEAEPLVKPGRKVPQSVLDDRGMSGGRAQQVVIAQLRKRIPKGCEIVLEDKQQIRRDAHGNIVWRGNNRPDLQMVCNGKIYAIEVDTKTGSMDKHKQQVRRPGTTSAFVKINDKAKVEKVEVFSGKKRVTNRGQWGSLLRRVLPKGAKEFEAEFEAELEREFSFRPAPETAGV